VPWETAQELELQNTAGLVKKETVVYQERPGWRNLWPVLISAIESRPTVLLLACLLPTVTPSEGLIKTRGDSRGFQVEAGITDLTMTRVRMKKAHRNLLSVSIRSWDAPSLVHRLLWQLRRVQESTQVLRELEISLRTNHIGGESLAFQTLGDADVNAKPNLPLPLYHSNLRCDLILHRKPCGSTEKMNRWIVSKQLTHEQPLERKHIFSLAVVWLRHCFSPKS
ncbi:hypothetical protein GOODEAATRI_004870, partial [Goodea atripinnis]